MATIGKKNAAGNRGNIFAGRIIVVTGKLENFTRDSINAKIESLGAKAGSSVSSNTDYLICGEKAENRAYHKKCVNRFSNFLYFLKNQISSSFLAGLVINFV